METTIQSLGILIRTWRIEILLVIAVLIVIGALVLLIILFKRLSTIEGEGGFSELRDRIAAFDNRQSHLEETVKNEIEKVVNQGKSQKNTTIKIIIETGLLNNKEKIIACQLVKESGADFVKTSTGVNAPGATVSDVKLLRKIVGPDFGVKASGGIRTYSDMIKLIEAGANRIGTSSGVAILNEMI